MVAWVSAFVKTYSLSLVVLLQVVRGLKEEGQKPDNRPNSVFD